MTVNDEDFTAPFTEADENDAAAPVMEEEPKPSVKFFFLVEVQHDDSVVLRTADLPTVVPDVSRHATTSDIVSTCQKVAMEMNNGVIIDNTVGAIRNLLLAVMPEQAPSQSDNLRAALAERGIELSIKGQD